MAFMVPPVEINKGLTRRVNGALRGPDVRSATMTDDLPPGPWSELLIGHHWPAASSLAVLHAALAQRDVIQAAHDSYAETLGSIAESTLADQRGLTADSARVRFHAGQRHARSVAERNRIKRESYQSAITATESLRADLTDIAERGNAAIEEIRTSRAPASAKVSAINEVIAEAHATGAARSALHAGSIYSAVQSIIDAEGLAPSGRAFATSHGLAFGSAPPPDARTVQQRVTDAVVEQ